MRSIYEQNTIKRKSVKTNYFDNQLVRSTNLEFN